MKDPSRTNAELIKELASLRQRIRELELAESDRNRAEEALAAAHRLLSSLLDAVPDLLLVVDKDYRIQYSNFKGYDLINQPDVEKQKTCYGRFKLRGAPCEDCSALPVFETGRSVEREMINPVDGHYREVRAFPIFNLKGQVEAVVEYVRDITERKQEEAALRESEKRYHRIADTVTDYIFTSYIEDGKVVKTVHGPGCIAVTGYSAEEFAADPYLWFNMVFPEDQNRVKQYASRILTGKNLDPVEHPIRRKDGRVRWVLNTPVPHHDSSGDLISYDGLISDITLRKRAEEALRESENKFRTFAEHSLVGIYLIQDGVLKYVNPKFAEISGYTVEECLDNMVFRDLVHPEDYATVKEQVSQRLSGVVQFVHYAFRGIKKTGEIIHVEVFGSSFMFNGRPTVTGTILDITERKLAEEALKSSLSLLSAFLEFTADGFLIVDRKGKIVRWNQKFADMWKIPEEVLSSRDDEKIRNYIHTQLADPEQFAAKVRKLYEQPEESSFDQIEFADGRVFERYSQPQRIEEAIVGRVWSFRDITEHKRAEAEKKKLEEQYRQAQKMEAIGQLAGGIAHDFNNMLNIMLGYSQLALMKLEPHNPLHANIQEIISAGLRSADLVRQLLAFARKQTIDPKVLDLNDTVAGMLNMLRKLIGEDIDLLWKPAANPWPVKMDPAQVDQILANLAVNARDSITGIGKITIETGKAEFDDAYCAQRVGFVPGKYAMLAVSDNGCGMDKDILEKIFDPFFTTKEIGKGTGMGLATVYGIVKQNNGFINIYSEPGKGAIFRIYLPWHREADTAIDEPHTHAKPLTGTETVLLVEDAEALLKMGKMMLEELGYTVLTAGSPGEAIKLAGQYAGNIHLLLTDVVMPEMSGRDLQKRLSAIRQDMKYLFMSGYTANVIAHRSILDEGVHFLQKPFHMEVLATKIREVLNRP